MPKPHSKEMFPQHDLAQFGVRARPRGSLSPSTRLELHVQDSRTSKQKAEDALHQEVEHTLPMFREDEIAPSAEVIRKAKALKQATKKCRDLLGMLEALQKAKGNVVHFIPAVLSQIAELHQTVEGLEE